MVNQGSDPGFVGDLLDYNKYVDLLLDLERVWRICDSEGFATKHFRDNSETECHFTPVQDKEFTHTCLKVFLACAE